MPDHDPRTQLLDTAEALFYQRGIQAVGMDELRTASGLSLKRLYQCFRSKQDLVEAYLHRRDQHWRHALTDYVTAHASTPRGQLLAVFDWLHTWFNDPAFRGCAFINSYGECGPTHPGVAQAAADHKESLRQYLTQLAANIATDQPESLARQLLLLVDGAITTAAITGDPQAAQQARTAATTLITAACGPSNTN